MRHRRALEKHITRMEQVLRALENEQLAPIQVGALHNVLQELLELDEDSCGYEEALHNHGAPLACSFAATA